MQYDPDVTALSVMQCGRVDLYSVQLRAGQVPTHCRCAAVGAKMAYSGKYFDVFVGTPQGISEYFESTLSKFPPAVCSFLVNRECGWERLGAAMVTAAAASQISMYDSMNTMTETLCEDSATAAVAADSKKDKHAAGDSRIAVVVAAPWMPDISAVADTGKAVYNMDIMLAEIAALTSIPCRKPAVLSTIGGECGRLLTHITPEGMAAAYKAIFRKGDWNVMHLPVSGHTCIGVFSNAGQSYFFKSTGALVENNQPRRVASEDWDPKSVTVCDCLRNEFRDCTDIYDCQLAGGVNVCSLPHKQRVQKAMEAISRLNSVRIGVVPLIDEQQHVSADDIQNYQRVIFIHSTAPYTVRAGSTGYVWRNPTVPHDCAVLTYGVGGRAMALAARGEPLLRQVGTMTFSSSSDYPKPFNSSYVCRPVVPQDPDGDCPAWLWEALRPASRKEPLYTPSECECAARKKPWNRPCQVERSFIRNLFVQLKLLPDPSAAQREKRQQQSPLIYKQQKPYKGTLNLHPMGMQRRKVDAVFQGQQSAATK